MVWLIIFVAIVFLVAGVFLTLLCIETPNTEDHKQDKAQINLLSETLKIRNELDKDAFATRKALLRELRKHQR